MANPGSVQGIRPLMTSVYGGPQGVSINSYGKPTTDSNPIYQFDLVQKTASSVPDPAGTGTNPLPGVRGANLATPGTGLYLGSALNASLAGDARTVTVMVVDDAFCLYLTQADSATPLTIASVVGKNANFNLSGASNAQLGNALTKQSGMSLNSASIATTAGKDCRILGFLNNSSLNSDNAAYPLLEVEIVLHQNKGQSAGV